MDKTHLRLAIFALMAAVSSFGLSAQASTERCDSDACEAQMKELEKYGQNGSPEALAIAALAYATGDGLEKDEDYGRAMMKEAIRMRSALGMYIKSRWRAQGFLFEKDMERSHYLLRRSAELGYEVANYEMAAKLLLEGDTEQGLEYLETAVEAGYVPALYVQARMMEAEASNPDELAAAANLYAAVGKNHRDAAPRLRSIITTLEEEPEADQKVVENLRQMRDMEVITVVGRDPGLDMALAGVNHQLKRLHLFDGGMAGTRLRRQRPCGQGGPCSVMYNRGVDAVYTGGTVANLFESAR